jgi:signal transduction histidine kinase
MDSIRVLLADDSEGYAELIRDALKDARSPIDLTWVCSVAEALDHLGRAPVDVVLLDLGLPDGYGLATLRKVRAGARDVPIVVLTGADSDEMSILALQQGAQDYLIKGEVEGPLLWRSLRYAIERRRIEVQLRETQQQLSTADRMASIGMLAACVAHEINNPLTAVMTNLDVVAGELTALPGPAAEKLRGPVEEAREAARRVRDIVRDVKVFSAPEDKERTAVDVRRVIESSLRLAANETRHRARVVQELGDVRPVHATEGRVGQIILNLVVNAAQAIAMGKEDENEIRVATAMQGERVAIEVRDSGSGIAPEHLPRIFDAFYTTKTGGRRQRPRAGHHPAPGDVTGRHHRGDQRAGARQRVPRALAGRGSAPHVDEGEQRSSVMGLHR